MYLLFTGDDMKGKDKMTSAFISVQRGEILPPFTLHFQTKFEIDSENLNCEKYHGGQWDLGLKGGVNIPQKKTI